MVTVIAHEMVSPAVDPVLLHSLTPVVAALARLADPVIAIPDRSASPKMSDVPSATRRSQARNPWGVFIRLDPLTVRSDEVDQERHGACDALSW